MQDLSHRRWNPLTQSWVLCSPHRAKRPWQGQVEKLTETKRPQHDPNCYLCPRNRRVGGDENPDYTSTFTFPNDFPAVQADIPVEKANEFAGIDGKNTFVDGLFRAEIVRGQCKVICFHPRHDLTIAQMSTAEIIPIIKSWQDIYTSLDTLQSSTVSTAPLRYVQIFENKGEIMGCSNPHPHGQVWATEQIPEEPRKEIEGFRKYKHDHGSCLLCDYVGSELENKSRIVHENQSFVCLVPFWAVWPFETMILPKKHMKNLQDINESKGELEDLSDIIRVTTCKYDNLFQCSFPYSMGLHQSPLKAVLQNTDDYKGEMKNEEVDLFHFHLHFYPPLLRSATVKKFQVGFEMLGMPQRDLTPEQAAARLRDCLTTHYLLLETVYPSTLSLFGKVFSVLTCIRV